MSAPQFTPGPWYGDGREDKALLLVYTERGRDICFVPEDGAEDQANAHLIAAAPDLYEALDQILWSFGSDIRDYDADLHTLAYAALAKARGEQ